MSKNQIPGNKSNKKYTIQSTAKIKMTTTQRYIPCKQTKTFNIVDISSHQNDL